METDFFDHPIGYNAADKDSDGTADNGREEQVQADIEIGEVGVVIQLRIVTPRISS